MRSGLKSNATQRCCISLHFVQHITIKEVYFPESNLLFDEGFVQTDIKQ